MVFFSSVAGITGNVGQADYASANAYLDTYAEYRNWLKQENKRKGLTLSISWPLWASGGMHVDKDSEQYLMKHWGMLPMPSEEGCNVFEALLDSGLSQAVVMYGDGDVIRRGFGMEAPTETPVQVFNEQGEEVAEDQREKFILYLKQLICKGLKLSENKLDLNLSLEKYGLDSIIVNKLTNQLEEKFGRLPKTLFFEHRTFSELFNYFIESQKLRLQELTATSSKGSEVNF